jgi:mono/diheme cytochrome c family protein
MCKFSAIVAALLVASTPVAAQLPVFGVGRPATAEEIRDLGAPIGPSGAGLPEGSGTAAAGREVFAAQCARCHGPKAQGDIGPKPLLRGTCGRRREIKICA